MSKNLEVAALSADHLLLSHYTMIFLSSLSSTGWEPNSIFIIEPLVYLNFNFFLYLISQELYNG